MNNELARAIDDLIAAKQALERRLAERREQEQSDPFSASRSLRAEFSNTVALHGIDAEIEAAQKAEKADTAQAGAVDALTEAFARSRQSHSLADVTGDEDGDAE